MSTLRIATWNVNGLRSRASQFLAWVAAEHPDVIALQELKATPEQLPPDVLELPGFTVRWHGAGPYSGVALALRSERFAAPVAFGHPLFDREQRVVTAEVGGPAGTAGCVLASVYAPNGGRDFDAKIAFYRDLIAWVAEVRAAGRGLVLAGDLNIAREERDVHPKERKAGAIGQRPEERELFAELLTAGGLVDVGRAQDPDNDELFTWWAPWRNLRQRNIGWRIDYLLMSPGLAAGARQATVQRLVGSSDHAPVMVDLELV
jgi:exodeoxyribonuclease-3